ncbi:MAG: hypothetical protein JO291_16150 [Acidimicrobiia bacterium]|nr:hypothetical protein [Acidimicrobiia bacterium]
MAVDLVPLPPSFASTRVSLHALAEHVLAPLRYRDERRIGLRPLDGGFGPPLPDRRVAVVGAALHDDGRTADITTLAAAATFLGVDLGAPVEVYTPATDGDPDRPQDVDADASHALGGWFAFGEALLADLAGHAGSADDPTEIQLWPEHFDLALSVGAEGARVNLGVSPGDADHDEPYLYVGPWEPRSGPLWNESWGASLGYEAIRSGADPTTFVEERRRALGD